MALAICGMLALAAGACTGRGGSARAPQSLVVAVVDVHRAAVAAPDEVLGCAVRPADRAAGVVRYPRGSCRFGVSIIGGVR